MNFYKKTLFIFILLIFGLIFIIKILISSFENKLLDISKSEKFYNFIEQRLKFELNRLSEREYTQEEIIFYSDKINQIQEKIKPIIDKIEKK